MGHAERRALVDRDQAALSLTSQAALLRLSRSSLYYQPVGPSAEEIAIKHRLDELYTAHPFYGSGKITWLLKPDWLLNCKRVQPSMGEMGLAGICPGPNRSRRAADHQIYPYLLPNVHARWPHQVWAIEITYIRLQHGFRYLVAILDGFSRYVVSWELDHSLELPFVLTALDRALAQAQPVIGNSDQGSHLTSPPYLSACGPSRSRLGWMVAVGRSILCSPNGSGAPSNTRPSISLNI